MLFLLCSCGVEGAPVIVTASSPSARPLPTPAATSTASPTPTVAATTTAAPTPTTAPTPEPTADPNTITVLYRVEVKADGGEDFARILTATMADDRGWSRANFIAREDPDAEYRVVLAEGAEVDALCRPYDTGGEFSCQNGPVVAINAERWREGVEHWSGDLASYRTMLLNHEMGHLLGQHHRDCPGQGQVAPVMQQQSGSLRGCRANSWPLESEIERAARHDLKLAPGFGE